jgi:AcrR family transcriptional regulator
LTTVQTECQEGGDTVTAAAERLARRPVDKFAARRNELAEAALRTLAERGYAQTGLRDIAQNSEFSHGVLHYYFADKTDLIMHCVREYKTRCATRYDEVVATATTADELAAGFLETLTATLVDDAPLHRLWYDLRNQSMFEPAFRADVAEIDLLLERMIWRIATRYAELSARTPQVASPVMYAIFDGLFQQALLRELAGVPSAAADLRAAVTAVLSSLFG